MKPKDDQQYDTPYRIYQPTIQDSFGNEITTKSSPITTLWSTIVFLFNIWTVFTSLLWASLHELPTDTGPLFLVFIEWVLLFEVAVRILMKSFLPVAYENMNLLHMNKEDSLRTYGILVIGSLPIMTLYGIIGSFDEYSEKTQIFSRLLLIKLLRSFEINRTVGKVEETLFYKKFKTLVFVKFVKNLMIVLFVTHFFTCAWMFIESSLSSHSVIKGNNSKNPFGINTSYFERNEIDASLIQKYVDSCVWAVSTLTACSFGDVTPHTMEEVTLSIFTFLIGVIMIAMIFSDFASLMYLLDIEKAQSRKELQQALKLCEIMGIPYKIRYRIQSFYALDNKVFPQTQYFSALKDLPNSLHTDIVLSLNKDTISMTNLFNFGSPDLLINISRKLYPKVSMAGDFIVRTGDYADEMFFIKQGEVEVLATDNKTRIAILREGAYFGEVGLLITDRRSVSVRALTACVFEVLKKNDFEAMLRDFPDQKKLLMQVATQRHKICSPKDLTDESYFVDAFQAEIPGTTYMMDNVERETNLAESRMLVSMESLDQQRNILKTLWIKLGNRFTNYACASKDFDFRRLPRLVMLPTSKFYYAWALVLGIALFANQAIVPYEISFGQEYDETPRYWRVLDVTMVVIYFIDIFVHMNTSIKDKKSGYLSDKDVIMKKYFHEKFAIDLIAFLPIDYLMMAMELPTYYIYWVKILRFFKLPRFLSILFLLHEDNEKRSDSFFLIMLGIFHTSFNHIAACIMHMIAKYEENNSVGNTMYKRLASQHIVDMPLSDQKASVQYVYFIYWAYSTSSSGPYTDIAAVTPLEKSFEIVTMIFFRIYFTFITAEVSRIFAKAYASVKENIDKKSMYEKWMSHIKLSKGIMERVRRFNEHIFTKYKDLDERQILEQLPSTTRHQILEFLLTDLLETVEVFPNEEVGLFSNVLQDFRFRVLTKGEDVFREGETAEEIFFILQGEVVIRVGERGQEISHLGKNDFFGESGIMEGKVGVRTETARAKTDVMLAVLNLTQLKKIWTKFPAVKEKMKKIGESRRMKIIKTHQHLTEGVTHEWILKDFEGEAKTHENALKEGLNLTKRENLSEFEQLRKELEFSQDINHSQIGSKLDAKKQQSPRSHSSAAKLDNENTVPLNKIASNESHEKNYYSKNLLDISIGKPKSSSKLPFTQQESQNSARGFPRDQTTLHNQHRNTKENGTLEHIPESLTFGALTNKLSDSPSHHHPQGELAQAGNWFEKAFIMTKMGFQKFEKHFKEIRPLILNLILFFDVMFAPLNIALEIIHDGPIIYVELTFASILVFNFLLNLKDLLIKRRNMKKIFPGSLAFATIIRSVAGTQKEASHQETQKHHHAGDHHSDGEGHHHEEHHISITTVFLDFVFMIPFTVIFNMVHVPGASTNFFLIVIQLLKLGAVEHLTWIFQREFFKKRYALYNIGMLLYAFVILNHLVACIFIMLANAQNDFNRTWYARIPAPQFNYPNNIRTSLGVGKASKYVHALYWAYVTTSHIGIGDVTAINSGEKIFTTIVMLISIFVYAFLFGNLASLVDDLTPKFQKEFETNYRRVLEYTRISKLDIFLDKIHKYYNYLWQNNKGIDENAILARLPNSLRYDIFLSRYDLVIQNSKFFKNEHGVYDPKIFYSFCKKFQFGVFMENDLIVAMGQEISDVYIILEGEVEILNGNVNEDSKLHPGDHLGGIIPHMIQLQSMKATKITKVAILSQDAFIQLTEAYPKWYEHIKKYETITKVLKKCARLLKQRIMEKKQKAAASPLSSNPQVLQNTPKQSPMNININAVGEYAITKETPPQELEVKEEQKVNQNEMLLKVVEPEEPMPSSRLGRKRRYLNRPETTSTLKLPNTMNSLVSESPNMTLSPNMDTNRPPPGDMHPIGNLRIETNLAKSTWIELIEPQESHKENQQSVMPAEDTSVKLNLGSPQIKKGESSPPKVPRLVLNSPEHDPLKVNSSSRSFMQNSAKSQPVGRTPIAPSHSKRGYFSGFFNMFANKTKRQEPDIDEQDGVATRKPTSNKVSPRESKVEPSPRKSIFGSLLGRGGEASPKKTVSQVERRPSLMSQDEKNMLSEENEEVGLKKAKTDLKRPRFTISFAEIVIEKKKHFEYMKSLKYYINPNSKAKTLYELAHTIAIIYSVFMAPIIVGFNVDLGWTFYLIEGLILLELILYPIFLMRTAQYVFGLLRIEARQVWQKFVERGFVIYILAGLPINLIFSNIYYPLAVFDLNPSLWIEGILRLNRVLFITKISPQFAFFGSKYPQISRLLKILKPTFYLVFVSHFIACLFNFVLLNEPTKDFPYNFIDYLELRDNYLGTRYLMSLDLTLSITTTTGYPELIIYNDYERLALIIFIYLGDAVFALILGWYTANSVALPDKYNYVFKKIIKMSYVLEERRLPQKIRSKIENYFAYIVNTRDSNKSCLEALSGLLPHTTLKDMASEQAKIFHNFPLLLQLKNKVLFKEIVQNLKQNIYLPHDYIISKGEYGSEMYCIAEGTVYMLSPNEKKILATLETGAFFGELAVYTKTKRLTSFVAASFCLIYILDQEILKNILKKFPQAESEFEVFVEKRLGGNSTSNTKNDAVSKAYACLHAIGNLAEAAIDKTEELLNHAEIPYSLLKAQQKTKERQKRTQNNKLQTQQGDDNKMMETHGDDEEELLFGSPPDCVEEDEINHRAIDINKNSFRVKTKNKERRFSRVQMGKEKSVAKAQSLMIRWGINLQ